MAIKLAGVVVLYNPEGEQVIENIHSYIDEVDCLIAVDNSDTLNPDNSLINFLRENNKIIYINNEQNLGIAQALNVAARLAIEQGYYWLLTMDQDSRFNEGMLQELRASTTKLNSSVGILSPQHVLPTLNPRSYDQEFLEMETVMTSGNLLNLKAYIKAGPFEEKLFIDYVDHEYCLRLKKLGFRIITVTNAYLIHSLGNLKRTKIGVVSSNHNYIRRYYMTRNRLYVHKKYGNDFPVFCQKDIKSMWVELLKVIFVEKQKITKLKAIFLGFFHFKTNKFGKL